MTNGKPKPQADWGDEKGKEATTPLTIEDRLAKLEDSQLTENELTGLRTILDRHGFDRGKGTF